VVIFIVVLTECQSSDLKLMRHDLSIELPFAGSVLVSIKMVLLEKRYTVVSVRGSEIVLTVGDNDLSHGIGVLRLIGI